MWSQYALLWIPGRHHQWPAGVCHGEPLSLDPVHAALDRCQEQAHQVVLEKIDIIDVEDTPMSLGEQPWLEYGTPLLHGGLNIQGTDQAVLCASQWQLYEGAIDDLGFNLAVIPALQSLASQRIPLLRFIWVTIGDGANHNLNARQDPTKGPCQRCFRSAMATANANATQRWVNRRKSQSHLCIFKADQLAQRQHGATPGALLHHSLSHENRRRPRTHCTSPAAAPWQQCPKGNCACAHGCI
mmetsp:Transcript_55673/g.120267  ORF Transcript_55673/g.120267 Transcript_55673/m.120267 type:complete len:242 (+) Transcript_55673:1631-2356(+)